MLTDKVNDVMNGTLANAIADLSLEEAEKLFLQMQTAKSVPEQFFDTGLIVGILQHAELLFARELKKRYNKISENN
jgi:hypothetical protein